VQARVPPEPRVALGEEVWLAIAPDQVHLFDPSTEQSLRGMA
jgi:multiple sugar transport system ATP-binding protein